MWQQSGSLEETKFECVNNWIKKLNQNRYAGFHDWRLPTLEEAMSLVEPEKKHSDLYINPIFDSKQSWIWTADQVKSESWAWVVGFYGGGCYSDHFDSSDYVRAVRSGQSF